MNILVYTNPINRTFTWKIEVPVDEVAKADLDLHDRELLEKALRPKELPSTILEALTMLVDRLKAGETPIFSADFDDLKRLTYLEKEK